MDYEVELKLSLKKSDAKKLHLIPSSAAPPMLVVGQKTWLLKGATARRRRFRSKKHTDKVEERVNVIEAQP